MPTPFIGKLSLFHQRVDFDAKTFTPSVDIVLPKSDKFGKQDTLKCSFFGVYPRFCVCCVNKGDWVQLHCTADSNPLMGIDANCQS